MKRALTSATPIACLAAALWAASTLTGADGGTPPACAETRTVFRDVSRFGRKHSAAENMTEEHAEHFARRWVFSDMEPYLENGDLEGFFLTYTRPAPCPAGE